MQFLHVINQVVVVGRKFDDNCLYPCGVVNAHTQSKSSVGPFLVPLVTTTTTCSTKCPNRLLIYDAVPHGHGKVRSGVTPDTMAYPHTVASKQTHSRQSARDIDNGGRYQVSSNSIISGLCCRTRRADRRSELRSGDSIEAEDEEWRAAAGRRAGTEGDAGDRRRERRARLGGTFEIPIKIRGLYVNIWIAIINRRLARAGRAFRFHVHIRTL